MYPGGVNLVFFFLKQKKTQRGHHYLEHARNNDRHEHEHSRSAETETNSRRNAKNTARKNC